MQRLINGFLFSAILFLPVLATASTLTIVNPDFSTPAIPCTSLDYVYQGSGTCSSETGGGNPFPQDNLNAVSGVGWTFGAAGDGLTGPGTAFSNPPAPSRAFHLTKQLSCRATAPRVSQSIAGFEFRARVRAHFLSRLAQFPCWGGQRWRSDCGSYHQRKYRWHICANQWCAVHVRDHALLGRLDRF